jgi:hypothetical protein
MLTGMCLNYFVENVAESCLKCVQWLSVWYAEGAVISALGKMIPSVGLVDLLRRVTLPVSKISLAQLFAQNNSPMMVLRDGSDCGDATGERR